MKIKLNLIPPYRREEIKKAKRFRTALKWELELAAILAVFIPILFSINYILQINLSLAENNAVENGKNSSQLREIEKYDAAIKDVNTRISELGKIQAGQLRWMNFFEKLNANVPDKIALNGIAGKGYAVSLSGRAADRDVLIAFREKLEQDECFSEINFPLSNLVAKENLDFQLDLNIKKDCLK